MSRREAVRPWRQGVQQKAARQVPQSPQLKRECLNDSDIVACPEIGLIVTRKCYNDKIVELDSVGQESEPQRFSVQTDGQVVL